jgi:hypothetical protein
MFQAQAEVTKVKAKELVRAQEKRKLEARRDQLYKRFSHVIEGM